MSSHLAVPDAKFVLCMRMQQRLWKSHVFCTESTEPLHTLTQTSKRSPSNSKILTKFLSFLTSFNFMFWHIILRRTEHHLYFSQVIQTWRMRTKQIRWNKRCIGAFYMLCLFWSTLLLKFVFHYSSSMERHGTQGMHWWRWEEKTKTI